MKSELIRLSLSRDEDKEKLRECTMSIEFFQNARQTMGELRDLMGGLKISWDFIQSQIDLATCPKSPIDKALQSMDNYTTGPGKSLKDLPSNVW